MGWWEEVFRSNATVLVVVCQKPTLKPGASNEHIQTNTMMKCRVQNNCVIRWDNDPWIWTFHLQWGEFSWRRMWETSWTHSCELMPVRSVILCFVFGINYPSTEHNHTRDVKSLPPSPRPCCAQAPDSAPDGNLERRNSAFHVQGLEEGQGICAVFLIKRLKASSLFTTTTASSCTVLGVTDVKKRMHVPLPGSTVTHV